MKTAHDLVAAAKARVQEISIADADAAILAADVLVHISRGMLEFKFSANPALQSRDLAVLLYCKTSGRAALAAAALHDMGYLNVRSIAGGFDAWAASGRPVAKPETPSFE